MYRIATSTCWLLLLACTAAAYPLQIDGSVTDVNGSPQAGITVMIDLRISPTGPSYYANTLITNADGAFADVVDITPNFPPSGLVVLSMIDCDSSFQVVSLPYDSANLHIVHHFTWCANAPPSCSLGIEVDTIPGGLKLIAVPAGTPPFSFWWNNNIASVSPTLPVGESGTYCVSMHDANGCTATACITVVLPVGPCNVLIALDTSSSNIPMLVAQPGGTAPFTYQWSTGDSTQSIPLQPNPASVKWCVTVTDAEGCVATDCFQLPAPNSCQVEIQQTNSGSLFAAVSGTPPFEFFWNNGEVGQTITPVSPGVYCVTVVAADSCTTADCFSFNMGCSVTIVEDSLSPTPNGWHLTAYASGTPPFTYYWQNAVASGPSITVSTPGTYCVKVIDANGCSATDCITVGNYPCSVKIVETSLPNSADPVLLAVVPANAYLYQWSSGDSTPYIVPAGPGTYCVTVTHSSGCTASACYDFDPMFGHFTVKGFVSAGDLSNNLLLQGTVYLYKLDNTSAGLSLFGQTPLLPNPTLPPAPGPHAWYDFGDVPPGQYIALALLAPNTPGSDIFLPTYYGDVTSWTDAKVIAVPHGGELFDIHLVKGDSLGGPGTIDGLLTKGPGLSHSGSSERDEGVAGATVLLFDEQARPLQYRITAADGSFSFSQLPWGTYELRVDLPGVPAASAWITIGPQHENAEVKFTLTSQGVTAAHHAASPATKLFAWPNPGTGPLFLRTPHEVSGPVELVIFSATGQPAYRHTYVLGARGQTLDIDLSHLPNGIYTAWLYHARGTATARFAICKP